jgi:hypothetical protein
VRIAVAHGAAFISAYLVEMKASKDVSPVVLEAAKEVTRELAEDNTAIVRRQLDFGKAIAKHDVEEGAGP